MNSRAALKIGLDYHGVIDVRPEYFAAFCREAMSRGYEIHIITGGPYKNVAEDLLRRRIPYSKIFAIMDYYEAKGQMVCFDDGSCHIPDNLWNAAKAEYCRQEGINLHIDDSSEYIKWFTTPYCRFDQGSDDCIAGPDMRVDFSENPTVALERIRQIIEAQS